jgi:hypothetical protein
MRWLAMGESSWALTEIDPADSPAIVILLGSPPRSLEFDDHSCNKGLNE